MSLDLFSPHHDAFFSIDEDECEDVEKSQVTTGDHTDDIEAKKLFRPLVFASQSPQGRKKSNEVSVNDPTDHHVLKATRYDKIKTLVLFCIMIVFLGVCIGWETHQSEVHHV